MHVDASQGIEIRRARTADVKPILRLIELYAPARQLLAKPAVTLYEDIQEFLIAEYQGAGPERQRSANGAVGEPEGSGGGPKGEGGGKANSQVIGCGALHVMWEDLAEIRTIAVDPEWRGRGVGHRLATGLLDTARRLGVVRVFVLTFEVDFFARHGFEPIDGTAVSPDVYEELRRSYDEGVAEFLDLERVKPNILGNTRMLLTLS